MMNFIFFIEKLYHHIVKKIPRIVIQILMYLIILILMQYMSVLINEI